MTFFSLKFRTYVHATESHEKVERALRTACGDDVDIATEKTSGFHGNPIEILETEISGKKNIDSVFSNIMILLPELFCDDTHELEKRLDDDCVVHMRFDKQAAYSGRLMLVSHEDVIAMQAKVRSYPASRAVAKKNLQQYILKLQNR
jgi:RNA binding exosome subunit